MPETVRRGRLKLLLGYAAGVGKTYQMLEEAQKLTRQSVDLVIGYFEPHGRKATVAKTERLELIPRRKLVHRGSVFEEMDVEAILRRRPQVCVVDEYAHTNVPGSERPKRWEDVGTPVGRGNRRPDEHECATPGKPQRPGVAVHGRPRARNHTRLGRQAGRRSSHGGFAAAGLAEPAETRRGLSPGEGAASDGEFFQEPTLVALRELALRQTAHEVDIRQPIQEEAAGALQGSRGNATGRPSPPAATDRILIHITGDPSTAVLIRRGRRVADFLSADCFAICVHKDSDLHDLPTTERKALERHLNFARNLQIETRVLQGEDVAKTLVSFARQHRITQVFLLGAKPSPWPLVLRRSLVQQVVRLAHDMQVIMSPSGEACSAGFAFESCGFSGFFRGGQEPQHHKTDAALQGKGRVKEPQHQRTDAALQDKSRTSKDGCCAT